jgi:hypothetical protein
VALFGTRAPIRLPELWRIGILDNQHHQVHRPVRVGHDIPRDPNQANIEFPTLTTSVGFGRALIGTAATLYAAAVAGDMIAQALLPQTLAGRLGNAVDGALPKLTYNILLALKNLLLLAMEHHAGPPGRLHAAGGVWKVYSPPGGCRHRVGFMPHSPYPATCRWGSVGGATRPSPG